MKLKAEINPSRSDYINASTIVSLTLHFHVSKSKCCPVREKLRPSGQLWSCRLLWNCPNIICRSNDNIIWSTNDIKWWLSQWSGPGQWSKNNKISLPGKCSPSSRCVCPHSWPPVHFCPLLQIEHDPRMPAYIATQGPLSHTISDFWQVSLAADQNSVQTYVNNLYQIGFKCVC